MLSYAAFEGNLQQPLYLDDLRQQDRKPTRYVCGQIGGVRYELLEQDTLPD